jgi:hypothetical protein
MLYIDGEELENLDVPSEADQLPGGAPRFLIGDALLVNVEMSEYLRNFRLVGQPCQIQLTNAPPPRGIDSLEVSINTNGYTLKAKTVDNFIFSFASITAVGRVIEVKNENTQLDPEKVYHLLQYKIADCACLLTRGNAHYDHTATTNKALMVIKDLSLIGNRPAPVPTDNCSEIEQVLMNICPKSNSFTNIEGAESTAPLFRLLQETPLCLFDPRKISMSEYSFLLNDENTAKNLCLVPRVHKEAIRLFAEKAQIPRAFATIDYGSLIIDVKEILASTNFGCFGIVLKKQLYMVNTSIMLHWIMATLLNEQKMTIINNN